jgi:hypothetical protein
VIWFREKHEYKDKSIRLKHFGKERSKRRRLQREERGGGREKREGSGRERERRKEAATVS